MRTLGGSIGLAAATIVFNQQIRGSGALSRALSDKDLNDLLKSPLVLEKMPESVQKTVGHIYAEAFTQEMKMAAYVAAVSFVVSLFTLQRNPPFQKKGPPGAAKKDESGEKGAEGVTGKAAEPEPVDDYEDFWALQSVAY